MPMVQQAEIKPETAPAAPQDGSRAAASAAPAKKRSRRREQVIDSLREAITVGRYA